MMGMSLFRYLYATTAESFGETTVGKSVAGLLRGSPRDCLQPEIERLEDRILLTAGNGLQGQYFDSADLSGPALVQIDSAINFDWGTNAPRSGIGSDHFSVRWTGQIEADVSEAHQFTVNANDGARLWVNGELLFDRFDSGSASISSNPIDLIAGRRYDIQLEFRENIGEASVQLKWKTPDGDREIIPMQNLYAGERGAITTEQWNGVTGNSVSDLTNSTAFASAPDSAATLGRFEANTNVGQNFGRRVRGQLHAPYTGMYRFFISANESAELWLSNSAHAENRELIASVDSAVSQLRWKRHPSQQALPVHLVAGQSYYIEALHKEASGKDHLAVGWIVPGNSAIDIIPGEQLSPVIPTVSIFAEHDTTGETDATGATFAVVRGASRANGAGPINEPLDVHYSISGDATNGTDYATLSGTITIPAGQDSATLTIDALVDTDREGTEFAEIELLAGDGYRVASRSERRAIATIQDNVDAPAGGTSLLTGSLLSDFSTSGGTFTMFDPPGYTNVIQAVIDPVPSSPFDSQLRQDNATAIQAGDVIWVQVYARSIGGDARFDIVFERDGTPYTNSLEQDVTVSSDWKRVQLAFVAKESYAMGEAALSLRLGFQLQTIQFREIELLNYGPPSNLHDGSDFHLNNIGGNWGTAQTVLTNEPGFPLAYQMETVTSPLESYQFQAVESNAQTVADTQTMRVTFYARALAGSNPQIEALIQRANLGFTVLGNQTFNLTSAWQLYSLDVISDADYDVDALIFTFNVGFPPQTVQIADFKWTNIDQPVSGPEDLPHRYAGAVYGGREAAANWRDLADQRIAADRKSQVTINVVDANGEPIDGALVHLRQQKHDFLFGSAINGFEGRLDPGGSNLFQKYQSEILRLFNATTDEGAMQWKALLENRARGMIATNFANTHGLYARGHSGIWPSRAEMPQAVWSQYDSLLATQGATAAEEYLRTETSNRITDIATTFLGQIEEWDVVNEPRFNKEVMQILGDSIVVDWFTQFKQLDSNVKLTLNENSVFSSNGDPAKRANYDYWVTLLNNAGVIDTLGEQGHYDEKDLTDIATLGSLIQQYHTQFNLPITVTEFDVDTRNLQLQADYLRDYMTMAFSQQGISKFMHWGFWESRHWIPDAALYRADFSIKPNGQAYEDLVYGSWWTDDRGTTRDGAFSSSVFKGQYEVIVDYNGQSYFATTKFDESGNTILNFDLPLELNPLVQFEYVANVVPFTFEDIAPDGTAITTFDDLNEGTATLTKSMLDGFEFTLFETTYKTLHVSTNGLISFGGALNSGANASLNGGSAAIIAPLWDNLDGSHGGSVLYKVLGTANDQRLVIQFDNWQFHNDGIAASDRITFQVILHERFGSIRFNYADITGDDITGGSEGASATVGIKGEGRQGIDQLQLSLDDGPNQFVGSGISVEIKQIANVRGTDDDDSIEFRTRGNRHIVIVNDRESSIPIFMTQTVIIDGKDGNDSFVIRGTSANETADVGPGVADFERDDFRVAASSFEKIRVDFRGGEDSARLVGSAGIESFVARGNTAKITGETFANTVSRFDSVIANGKSGADTAVLSGTSGVDTLSSWPTKSTLRGNGILNVAIGFERVIAIGRGGSDTAVLNGSNGDDKFVSTPDRASLSGVNFRFSTLGFDHVAAFARGGVDTAALKGSRGSEEFATTPVRAIFSGSKFRFSVSNFDRVTAYAKRGRDSARFKDSSGDDLFVSNSKFAYLKGAGFWNTARGFDLNTAHSTNGIDTALLTGTSGKDTIRGSSRSMLIAGRKYSNEAIGFAKTIVDGGRGNDLAVLNDSAENDRLVSMHKSAMLSSASYSIRIGNVEDLHVIASAGGDDIAIMKDSKRNDTYVGRGVKGELRGKGFSNRINRFESVIAISSDGTDTFDVANLRYVFKQIGPWVVDSEADVPE